VIDKEIKEISREEIVDETDSYQSNQSKSNERMRSRTIIDSVEPIDSSCLQTTAFLPQSNVFDSINLIHEFFFNLIPHWHSISHPMPIQCQFMHSCRTPIAGCHERLSSVHINPLHDHWSFGYLAHHESKVCSDFSYVPLQYLTTQ